MNIICNTSECTGCMACANICPYHAISVVQDEEGFDRPKIDQKLCMDCGLCQKTCPINYHPSITEPKRFLAGGLLTNQYEWEVLQEGLSQK